jgi:CHAT domain-containing protein
MLTRRTRVDLPEMKPDHRIGEWWQACRMDVARIVALAVILSALVAAPALPREPQKSASRPGAEVQESADPDDLIVEYVDEEREGAASAEAARSTAPPPRSVDDITQALQRYKPDPQKAERDRAAARASPPEGAYRKELFAFYLDRSKAAQRIGMLSQSIADLQLAEGWASTREERRQAYNLRWHAEAFGGNYLKAVAMNEAEQARGAGINLRKGGARGSGAACNLAFLRPQLGDIDQAKQDLSVCENNLRSRHDRDHSLDSWTIANRQAVVYAAAGNLAEAEAAARKAIAEMELYLRTLPAGQQQTPFGGLAQLRNYRDGDERRLAEILLLRGKRVEAEIAIRNVLRSRLAHSGLYSLGTGSALTVLSRVVLEQGRFKDAATLGTAAVGSLEQAGAVPESLPLVEARKTYAAALAAQQRWDDAIAEFQKMQTGLERDPLLAQKYGVGDINWAWALIRTGKPEAARRMLEPMIERTRQRLGDKSYELAELRGFYALALATTDRSRALREFAAAVPILLEQSRADDASENGGIARTLRRTQILEGYIALLADLASAGGNAGGIDPVGESFRLADAARGSGVQRALSASAARAQISDPQLAQLARQEQDSEQRIATLTDFLNRLLSAPPDQQLPKAIGDMRKEIEALHASIADLKREIQRRFPAYANLVNPAPATIAQTRAALRPGEALVSIYVGDTSTYVWAVAREGPAQMAVAKIGDREVAAAVARLRHALDVGAIDLDRMPAYDVAGAYELFKTVLLPVAAGWKDAASLAIVPHRALGQLPFSLLVTEPTTLVHAAVPLAEYKKVPWLVRRVAVTQLPSINALVMLRQAPPGSSGRRSFIGFGDPIFSKEQLALAPQQVVMSRGLKMRSAPLARDGVNSAQLSQLPRLPDTAEEIRDIAGLLKADMRSDVFLGVAANERNVKTADLASHAVVAFATHGLVPGDIDGLDQPALALTAPDVADVDGDGLLTMDEVLALKLDADWVVLSACNTAAGDGAGSEAVSGLGRAFFYAGARALLVSNWPVESASARALTTEIFHLQAVRPSLSRAEALRQAMLRLIDGPGYVDGASSKSVFSYAHPLFWAPFSLVGDGGAAR